jgi:hypothetical protein
LVYIGGYVAAFAEHADTTKLSLRVDFRSGFCELGSLPF